MTHLEIEPKIREFCKRKLAFLIWSCTTHSEKHNADVDWYTAGTFIKENPVEWIKLAGRKFIYLWKVFPAERSGFGSMKFKLLSLLAKEPGRIFSRDQLLDMLYESSTHFVFDLVAAKLIARSKIKTFIIHGVPEEIRSTLRGKTHGTVVS